MIIVTHNVKTINFHWKMWHHMARIVATRAHLKRTMASCMEMWPFRENPVCPDPVWNLSRRSAPTHSSRYLKKITREWTNEQEITNMEKKPNTTKLTKCKTRLMCFIVHMEQNDKTRNRSRRSAPTPSLRSGPSVSSRCGCSTCAARRGQSAKPHGAAKEVDGF